MCYTHVHDTFRCHSRGVRSQEKCGKSNPMAVLEPSSFARRFFVQTRKCRSRTQTKSEKASIVRKHDAQAHMPSQHGYLQHDGKFVCLFVCLLLFVVCCLC